jgi:hypothetical protein
MPRNNRFQHQEYLSGLPISKFHLLRPEAPPHTTPADLTKRVAGLGTCLREAGVVAIYLVHGSFVGADALGFLREIARVWPAAGDVLRRVQKQTLDNITRDAGNFSRDYAQQMQDALQFDHSSPIPVKLFHWSSENHHIGRADGAIRLLGELATQPLSPGDRLLIWGHSHGGNLLALLTNLLANDAETNDLFFRAARPYYCWPGTRKVDMPAWPLAAELLADVDHPLRGAQLDLVTMGTPLRYGWDSGGCANLLHFVNHRPCEGVPDHLARFPRNADDVLQATGGDVIQQFGVAGTNFAPPVWAWRASLADRALGSILQSGIRKRDLLDRLRLGCRLHADGTNLLVDYGPCEGNIAQHHAGHAVYTRTRWLPFHLEQIARRCYGLKLK